VRRRGRRRRKGGLRVMGEGVEEAVNRKFKKKHLGHKGDTFRRFQDPIVSKKNGGMPRNGLQRKPTDRGNP